VFASTIFTRVQAGEVVVAVASNFIKPMQRITGDFKEQTGHEVKISFGSSGKLLAQITHGAPFDVFLSADSHKAERLIKNGFAVSGSSFIYAQGRLVLWSASNGFIDDSPKILQTDNFKYIALADAKLAPYGKAANEVMQKLEVEKKLKNKFVKGENISQTYQFVQTGNAQLGFVALSQVNGKEGKPQGSKWIIPAGLHEPINQSAVILQRGKNNPAAIELIAYLQKKTTQALIKSFGYDTINSPRSYANAR
jgi:molybdate transport system substrate-binding protein